MNNDISPATFSELGLSASLLKVLTDLGLVTPTPIQLQAIPVALTSQDLIGIAQTGTGKTFAFGLPMIQRVGLTKTQGLVIAPTRELALQVEESLQKLGRPLGLRTAILIGGENIDKQLFQLRKKPHIIIATPGRIIDHIKRRTVKLEAISTLVLDEADMMLDMGFMPQIKEILEQLPLERQTMLFSATMPEAIVKIAATYMKLPVSIEVAPPGTPAAQIEQEIFIVKHEERLANLQKILASHSGSVLVFVRTKHGVKTLNMKLQAAGLKAVEIHSNLSLSRRRAALSDFKSKKARIMVATDVAARGLDINDIELVVNYHLPDSPEDYVHRIGRTARAGKAGKAISLATTSELKSIKIIERLINRSIKRTDLLPYQKKTEIISSPNRDRRRGAQGTSSRGNKRFNSGRKFQTKKQENKEEGRRPRFSRRRRFENK